MGKWISWTIAFGANGFIVFLWLVFGLAAAGNAQSSARAFIWASVLGAGTPFLLSLYFISKDNFGVAIAWLFAMMPLIILFTWMA